MRLSWSNDPSELSLEFKFGDLGTSFSLRLKDGQGERTFSSAGELAAL